MSFRIHPEDLAEINRMAAAHRMSRTEFVVSKVLDRLDTSEIRDDIAALERRIERLERRVELASGY